MMVTLVLSSNMKRMLKNNVLVRKLVGIETAGSLNVLFTDKTGTLTKGKLEVVQFMLGNGNKYTMLDSVSFKYRHLFVSNLIYNNESIYDGSKIVGGNITDKAILDFVKCKRNKGVKILKQNLFDSSNKCSSVLVLEDGKKLFYVKGASEVLFDRCDRYIDENGSKQLLLSKDILMNRINEVTKLGIRVLCVAYQEGINIGSDKLVLLGFLFIKDDVREEAREGVKLIKDAGISVVMITGDNKGTAMAIAKEVGILNNSSDIVLTSEELNRMSDLEVCDCLSNLKIVARAMPNDKSRLVNLAKKMNLVVGMTGDGVNDAIALKRADVGFSMGNGTEVAKEASDIVIMDDNILSISKAILYGRTIFKSIRKFIIFQLTINFCAVSVSVIGPFIGIQYPVTVIQMLWINMVMDTLAGLAFSYEPALLEYMKELPKKRDEKIINSYMFNEIIVTGIFSSFLCIFFLKSSYLRSFFRYSVTDKYVMTAFFGLFIFISIFNSLNARTVRLNILHDIFYNKVFLFIISGVALMQVGMIYYGGDLFRTSGLNSLEFMVMICVAFMVVPFNILVKFLFKKFKISINI